MRKLGLIVSLCLFVVWGCSLLIDTEPGSCSADEDCAAGLLCVEGACRVVNCQQEPDFTPCRVFTDPDREYDICVDGECVSPWLTDTGQRQCFDDSAAVDCADLGESFAGQDALHGWDTQNRLIDRFTRTVPLGGQPVVVDNASGLNWQGCVGGYSGEECQPDCAGLDEPSCGPDPVCFWNSDPGEEACEPRRTWDKARAYCDALDWGGQADWRLPSRAELHSLLLFRYDETSPAIDRTVFPMAGDLVNVDFPSLIHWSSSPADPVESQAWFIGFVSGGFWAAEHSKRYLSRCVRGDTVSSAERFVRRTATPEQPVVQDKATGMIWQGCIAGNSGDRCETQSCFGIEEQGECEGQAHCRWGDVYTTGNDVCHPGKTWAEALAYCEGLEWDGQDDWRLPNMMELSLMGDETRKPPVLDPFAFPDERYGVYWSSTTVIEQGNSNTAWALEAAGSNSRSYDKQERYLVRCARGRD